MITYTSEMSVDLIEATGSDEKIAQAARTSTKGLNNAAGRTEGLIRALWREGHVSPFEHCHLTFALHVPLFVRDQIVRHKSMAFNIQSGRYREFEPVFYLPAESRPLVQAGKALDYRREHGDGAERTVALTQARYVSATAWGAYRAMLDAGVCKEVARAVLPASTYTAVWVTGSLRSWLHFLDQRLDEHAQWEVRMVASRIDDHIRDEYPHAYAAWAGAKETSDG